MDNNGWQPIATAPEGTDYTDTVDLWLTNNERSWRIPNCRESYSDKGAWINSEGDWVTGGRYLDEKGAWCWSTHPMANHPEHATATHWMLPPSAPGTMTPPNVDAIVDAWHSVTDRWITRRDKGKPRGSEWEVVHDWGDDCIDDETMKVVAEFATSEPADELAERLENDARATAVLRLFLP